MKLLTGEDFESRCCLDFCTSLTDLTCLNVLLYKLLIFVVLILCCPLILGWLVVYIYFLTSLYCIKFFIFSFCGLNNFSFYLSW